MPGNGELMGNSPRQDEASAPRILHESAANEKTGSAIPTKPAAQGMSLGWAMTIRSRGEE